jgi:predicted HAD superfamily Cof-like phosphohydrolase
MTIEQKQVAEFMEKAGQVVEPSPVMPDLATRRLRAKLMLEEVLETIEKGLGLRTTCPFVDEKHNTIGPKTTFLFQETEEGPDLIEIADGLGDLDYVGRCGTGAACGIDMEPIFQEIHRSNMSKFIDGHRREDGKWIKGPSYTPANLGPIIEDQIRRVE